LKRNRLPSKVIPLDATGWSWDNSFSRKTITFATPFASADYVVDFIFNDPTFPDYYDYGGGFFTTGYSGKTASGFTLYTSQDITGPSLSGWTGYVQCIAAGSSNGSGLDGTSGTSGTSGSSGSDGTSGSSGISNSFFNYQAKTVSFGAPGAGYITWNQSPQTGATFLNVSEQDQQNDNIDIFLANLGSGSVITLQDKTNHSNYQVWQLGTSTDNTTYWTFPVTLISATHQFSGNDNILFIITTTPSGTSGTSGTSGGSGSSGSGGTSGTSGTSGDSLFALTGSVWNTTNNVGITGSLSVSGSQSNTGSITNIGDINILTPSFNSGSVKFNITGSNSISSSNIIFGGSAGGQLIGQAATNLTGSIVISGSNNIIFSSQRANTLVTAGTYGYIGGNGNIVMTVPTLNTGSLISPSYSNNNLNNGMSMTFTTSSTLALPVISNNVGAAAPTINHPSGSISLQNNSIYGGFTSTANVVPNSPTISANNIGGGVTTLNHNSSSINYQSNIGGGVTITNNYSSSISNAVNNINVTNNIIMGTTANQNILTISGSNTANRRTIANNLIIGTNNNVNSISSGSSAGHLINTSLLGESLIISGSNTGTTTGGGSVFVGRFNATGSLQESSQDTIFVVGAGTSAAARKNALRIDNSGNTSITGSLSVSGSQIITGSIYGDVSTLSISSNTASLDLSRNNLFTLQLVSGSNTRIEPSNIRAGQTVNILLSTTGSATVSFPTTVKQISGSAYVPTTSTSTDIITLVSFDATNLYLAQIKNLV